MKNVCLAGLPFDKKSSFLQGTALAPNRIREALHNGSMNWFTELGINLDDEKRLTDVGDLTIQHYMDIETQVARLLEAGNRLLCLGGDHSVTYPIIKAHSHFYRDIHILHIDAHADLYDVFEGDKYSHACPFARIMENKLASRLVQVGIRTLTSHQRTQADRFGVEIIEMKAIQQLNTLTFTQPIYISLDLDAFDPAFAPGVSHHEPGGLTTREVINLIHRINVPIVGADIVEFNPHRDIGGITAALAAKMIKEITGKMLTISPV